MTKEEMRTLYRWLVDTRALCKVMIENRPKIHGPLLTALGQEAIGVGIIWALWQLGIAENSWKFPTHRTMWAFAAAMSHICGEDLSYELIKHHYLKATGVSRGRDANVHCGFPQHRIGGFDVSHMGEMAGVAEGTAEALRYNEYNGVPESKRPVTIFCCGEGAAQQGIIHEVMNWAAASNAKLSEEELKDQERFLDDVARQTGFPRSTSLILGVEVNENSIFVGPRDEHGNAHLGRPSRLAMRALGYPGWVGIDVDGDDVLAVNSAMQLGIKRSQRSEGCTLIIFHTYRRTAHNEDQHGLLTEEEKRKLEASYERDPLKLLNEYLVQNSILSDEECQQIEDRAKQEMEERERRAWAEPSVSLEEHRKDTARFAPHVYTLEEISPTAHNSENMRYRDAIRKVVRDLLISDPRMVYFGEDIAHPSGGVLGLWPGFAEEFGKARFFHTPISEEAIVGVLAGMGFAGMRPWAEFEFAPFGKEALVQIDYVVAPAYYQKRRSYPIVLVNHYGVVGDGGSGHFHSNNTELDFYKNQGWKVIFPADAYDAAGLLRAAHEDPNPVAIYLNIYAFGRHEFSRDVPFDPYMIPLGKAAVKRQGKDLTVVSYGASAVQAALNEAGELAKEGIDLEVIDLRTIVPLDIKTVTESLRKTERLLILHEAALKEGAGIPIDYDLRSNPELFGIIRNPPTILAAQDIPIPSAEELEWDRLPFEQEKIEDKASGNIMTRLRSRLLAERAREAMRY